MKPATIPAGLWSATPTPFTSDLRVDAASVRRMVEHHVALGVSGLMVAGTCGEGPWLTDGEREVLTRTAVEAADGRLRIAVHVTDNSVARVVQNIAAAARHGAELAVVAAPYFWFNATPARLVAHHLEIARHSPLPVGFYDRGAASAYSVPESQLDEVLADPRIVMVKDSSNDPARRERFLAARRRRPDLVLFNGDEFNCVNYLRSGYDGLLLGGTIFNARLAHRISAAVQAGDIPAAEREQARMNDLMYRVYGGPKITCWLAGLKELLVQLGVFSTHANLLGYVLTEHCREQIRAAVTGADGLGFDADLFGEAVPAAPKAG